MKIGNHHSYFLNPIQKLFYDWIIKMIKYIPYIWHIRPALYEPREVKLTCSSQKIVELVPLDKNTWQIQLKKQKEVLRKHGPAP